MAKVIKLDEYKVNALWRDGFDWWHQKYKGQVDVHTRLEDLTAMTLSLLADPGAECSDALSGMIIGFLGYGQTPLAALDGAVQNLVIDIHFLIVDHIRFEMMARLGWLERVAGNQFSLFEIVCKWDQVKTVCKNNPPLLSCDHPDFPIYQKLIERDQQVFIRRMLPSALDAFKRTIGK